MKKFTYEIGKIMNPKKKLQYIKGYDRAIIGITMDGTTAVYSITKMVSQWSGGEMDNEKKLQSFFMEELPRIEKKYKDVIITMDYIYG